MALFKCKMCGGTLELTGGESVATCEYCGTQQTVPAADGEKKLSLFSRANHLRMGCEFDKAAGIYESIVADFPEEAEAYWGLVLCKYGIEYVDDPATGKKVPTCHRSSFDSVMDDADLEQALENADSMARRLYREEAKAMEELRRGIIEVSGQEAPYDIFICYKETDENGDRTTDSVIAQDVYDALTEKGYRVFFSRISLEDKLGTEYEPYIFAALNSAKIMLVFGTDYERFHAVWVKNEWSRYLKLMAADKTKHLIPCYKGVDAYDMPKEFAKLQAQDMGKVGAIQDLLRGIEKLLPKQAAAAPVVNAVAAGSANTSSLLERAFMFLEDGEWSSANEYCEKVLDIDPKCAEAYLGKLMAELKVKARDELQNCATPFDGNNNYKKAVRFADDNLKNTLTGYIDAINARIAKRQEEERIARERLELKRRKLQAIRKKILPAQNSLAATCECVLGLKTDGTVIVTCYGEHEDCSDAWMWTNIVAVSANTVHAVGLKANGTVVATGDNAEGQCNVEKWSKIVAVSAGAYHTVGLRADGSVVATGLNDNGQCNVTHWKDVVAVSAGGFHTVGLKSDGTVIAAGNDADGACDVSDWTDIVAISAGGFYTVGLRSDGTAVAVGRDCCGSCDVSDWTDIVAINAGSSTTVGLKADGTVIAVGFRGGEKNGTEDWTNIVAISSGDQTPFGLRADGTAISAAYNVTEMKLFNHIDTLEQERIAAREEQKKDEQTYSQYLTAIAIKRHASAETVEASTALYEEAAQLFAAIKEYKNSAVLLRKCQILVSLHKYWEKEGALEDARKDLRTATHDYQYRDILSRLQKLAGWKDADQLISECRGKLQEAERLTRQRLASQQAFRRIDGVCQHCGGTFKGFFTKTCSSCGKVKDY